MKTFVGLLSALAIAAAAAQAAEAPSCTENFRAGCILTAATHSEEFPGETRQDLLDWYNHEPAGCIAPATDVRAIYSPYRDGTYYFIGPDNIVELIRPIDRVFLRDLLDGKAHIDRSKIRRQSCSAKSTYLPTNPGYSIPKP